MNTTDPNNPIPSPGPSAAKLRLVEDELKATKEALEMMIIERDTLFQQRHECVVHITTLEYQLGEQNRAMNEMSAQLIKLCEHSEVD